MTALKEYIAELPTLVSELDDDIKKMLQSYELLDEYKFDYSKDDTKRRWNTFGLLLKISQALDFAKQSIKLDKERFEQDMLSEQEDFAGELSSLTMVVSGFSKYSDLTKSKDIAANVTAILDRIKRAVESQQRFNSREIQMERPVTDYNSAPYELSRIQKTFEPFSNFWLAVDEWNTSSEQWTNGKFNKLDPEQVDKVTNACFRNIFKCLKQFEGKYPDLVQSATNVKSDIDGFKQNIPLVQALRQPGMRERHWDQLTQILGFKLRPDDAFTLRKGLEEFKLQNQMDAIVKVCDIAGKEFAIEQALDKMENDWKGNVMAVKEYRDTGTYVLGGWDEIFQLLDDQIVMTQAMTFSPHKKVFAERLDAWERGLRLCSDILEQLLACQRNWMYLEPIFASDDIQKQLPTESKRFQTVDRNWRKFTAEAFKNPAPLQFCNSERLLHTFVECNKLLDMVAKGLSDYLETKRSGFARFYFLSNDELLEILSQTRDPLAVQPHLRKCFEAIDRLDFAGAGAGMTMIAMNSAEKEKAQFDAPVQVKGNVENWLSAVEAMMKRSIKTIAKQAAEDYLVNAGGRKRWVQEWQGQLVLAGSQHYWSIEMEAAINRGGNEGLRSYFQKMLAQLQELVDIVRSNPPFLISMTLGALMVIDVHARDVTQKMCEDDVDNVNDFSWVSQLRYYWEDTREDLPGLGTPGFIVRQVQASFPYGMEYLGNTPRLVITPLTDRCYITLTGAMHLLLGGAPQGPAGTGKTETTKDLAKALAKQCVVFNCSDGLDYLAMGKFFKGLASSGAWACFDEFNRINVEVLSVIAQQIISIQKAIKAGLTRFVFEGSDIVLDKACAVFITMNPGYAGRAELPDNLKALFRPMAMMVPDYALIAEISLFSFGFGDPRPSSKKIVGTFKLSSEQLSSQDHYDFGMRAVKSVISAAGLLKRAQPDSNEEILVMCALLDVNRPKFLVDDLILFNGIISDLFPGVKEPERDYGALMENIVIRSRANNLQPVDAFTSKCIQLYETTTVRHGLMLVGPTGGGKTCCNLILAEALTASNGIGFFKTTKRTIMNPKSITMGQLYGSFDENTHEWTDGILSTIVRTCTNEDSEDKKWIICDGPVDAVWIENMNTVLDDNKKLCLVSGEIIKLSATICMQFEVEDLAVASPATVSRCGMIFIEPAALGVKVLCTSWMERLPEEFKPFAKKFEALFDEYVSPSLIFLRRNLIETAATVDNNLVTSMLKIIDCLIKLALKNEDHEDDSKVKPDKIISEAFLFALIWSIGATCDFASRSKFDLWLRETSKGMESREHALLIPGVEGVDTCYDLQFSVRFQKWMGWFETVPPFVLDSKTPFSEIAVPTIDTVRSSYILEILIKNDFSILCCGSTGTGKSVVVNGKLEKDMPDKFVPKFMAFSASTSANQTQDIIDSAMDKRRKGVFGPPLGKKMVIVIDDLNMPTKEVYGAQPPIEIIRQWFDHKGWYDRKTFEFRNLIDLTFCGVMGPPGGGRTSITNRLMRHFNFLAFPEMGNTSLNTIFSTILGTWIKANFSSSEHLEAFTTLSESLVKATTSVFQNSMKELLPTPAKSHYSFNLRDLAKVFQGILMSSVKQLLEPNDLIRLWVHECNRVFQDRLINDDDRNWFKDMLSKQMTDIFRIEYSELVTGRLMYGDYIIPGAEPKLYQQVHDFDKLVKTMEEYLDDYNASTTKKMSLVMFLDAIEHISRISRIIRSPKGNALLLGVGGSGRQSLTRLAAFIADYKCFSIEITKGYGKTEWREDLKKCLKTAGMENLPIVFLFTDTQIVKESFMEDINAILNSGDVPNIYASDEIESISGIMRPILQAMGMPLTKTALYSSYLKRVQNNLHVVLAFSPVGDAFRTRLRMYPALVNCCSLDWFSNWPAEALLSVARLKLAEIEFESPAIQQGVYDLCSTIHSSVTSMSVKYLSELGRHNHVTPTSYLELLNTYMNLYGLKKTDVQRAKHRLQVGLEKLNSTAEIVTVMQAELVELQPVLLTKTKEVEELMVVITRDKAAAEITAAGCAEEESSANEKASKTKAIADDAQRDLDEALPALDAAVASLKSLNRNDIVEVKSLGNPPQGVKMVMEAVCIMMDVKVDKIKDPNDPMKKIDDYWGASKTRVLADPTKFLNDLFEFEKDNIKESTIKKIQPYIDNPEFTPQAISKVSKACTSICLWVCAMHKYYNVARMVEPKKKALAEAQAELDVTLAKLAAAQKELKEVNDRVEQLELKFNEAVNEKTVLTNKYEQCTVKMGRADKLIGGLGGEKVRWQASVSQFEIDFHNIPGDVLSASGAIAYMGAFTGLYRKQLYELWQESMSKINLPHSAGCNLISVLEDPVAVRQWRIDGLPADPLSTENGIIISKARRWPLMIDPETQANKWIKAKHLSDSLAVIKLSDKDYLRTLENAIRFGKPVLLENVQEELDASLEPLLLKQVYKQGGQLMINLGDSAIPYHEEFLFYITSKLRNPYYTPETAVKVSLLNFAITEDGLVQQLLGVVVAEERPDLAQMKDQLVVNNAAMSKQMTEIESSILKLLAESTGDILEDETLINTLAESKKTSTEIAQKLEDAEVTEREIDQLRMKYTPVAFRSTILYFAVADLSAIDPMYQYSLGWFVRLYRRGIQNSEASDDFDQRLMNIIDFFTYSIYVNCCRSLFETHKLMFSFLLYSRIQQGSGRLDTQEYKFLLAGPTSVQVAIPNPAEAWLPNNSWIEISNLAKLPNFQDLDADFAGTNLEEFKLIYDSVNPQTEPLPGKWDLLTSFQRCLILRALRPDKCIQGIQITVAETYGERFIEAPPFDLPAVFADSSATSPLIFVLSSGADPTAIFLKFAEDMGFGKKLDAISLGQGQGPFAEKMINEGKEKGSWVLLQNCHLATSWMPTLERLVESLDPELVHKDFRLWLTSMPSSDFPVSVLQDGAKMVKEPPKGIRTNMLGSYLTFDQTFLDNCSKMQEWKKLLFGLCFLHAVVQDRRKFGPLGWNIPYEFAAGDLDCCVQQLQLFLNDYDEIPWAVLQFLEAEINYGGRVTDDKDRRLLNTIVRTYTCKQVLERNYFFSESGLYFSPESETLGGFLDYIRSLPLNPGPEAFGLHDNADITCAQNETFALMENLLLCQPKSASAGGAKKDVEIINLANDILKRIPVSLDIVKAYEKYPTDYHQSMNTVLTQEIIRFNNMLKVINSTLKNLLKAIKGIVAMSAELDAIGNSMFNNQVPALWASKAYPSLKPLAPWLIDLEERLTFISQWVDGGHRAAYWISGFFFPQAFLTANLQNYARKHQYAIDKVSFDHIFIDAVTKDTASKPEDGCIIYGLYMEACRWDYSAHCLADPIPKVLFSEAPCIWLNPMYEREPRDPATYYDAPIYKTLARAGTLSTTGHSTNFVLMLEAPSDRPQAFWIKRAAAFFCALKF